MAGSRCFVIPKCSYPFTGSTYFRDDKVGCVIGSDDRTSDFSRFTSILACSIIRISRDI
jgi:hypothetical protein